MSSTLVLAEIFALTALFAALMRATLSKPHTASRRRRILVHGVAYLAILLHLGPLLFAALFALAMRFISRLQSPLLLPSLVFLSLAIVTVIVLGVRGRRRDATGTPRAACWPRQRLITAWVALLALTLLTLWNVSLQSQIEIQAMRAEAGNLALATSPPGVPDSMNAAPLYAEAIAAFKSATTPEEDIYSYVEMDPRSPEVAAFLQRQARALELFRRAADLPEYHIPWDRDITKVLSNLAYFRSGAYLLRVAARVEASAGNVDAAIADVNRMHVVAHHASCSPMLISTLVSLAVSNIACNSTAETLPFITSKEQLSRLKIPDPSTTSRAFTRALRNEEAYNIASFCDLATGRSDPTLSPMPPPLGYLAWNVWLREDLASLRQYMRQIQELSSRPYPTAFPQVQRLEQDLVTHGIRSGIITKILAPSMAKPFYQSTNVQALQICLSAAAGATRYRLEHGSYPESLEQLAPGTPFLDPFDGKPIRVKRSDPDTLILYSIGDDLKDDGGDFAPRPGKRSADVGVTISKAPDAR